MPKFKCLYSTCTEYRVVVESRQAAPKCGNCNNTMASAEQPADPDFSKAAGAVQKYLEGTKKWTGSYHKNVIENLWRGPFFFQKDFYREMAKDTEFGKFVGRSTRPTHPDKICVDNALRAVQYAFPDWFPTGEKFTFELPYLMEAAGWEFLSSNDVFTKNFTNLKDVVAANRMYLVCAKKKDNDIGHMIVITTGADKTAYITDAQKQPNTYSIYQYVAWEYGAAPQNRPRPYREVNLADGKFSGSWEA